MTSRKHLSSFWECSLLFERLSAASSSSFLRRLASSLAALASSRACFVISSAFLNPSSRFAFSRAASFRATLEEVVQRNMSEDQHFEVKSDFDTIPSRLPFWSCTFIYLQAVERRFFTTGCKTKRKALSKQYRTVWFHLAWGLLRRRYSIERKECSFESLHHLKCQDPYCQRSRRSCQCLSA